MASKHFLLSAMILLRNIAPLLACTPIGEPSTTTAAADTTTTTTGSGQCTAEIDICPSALTGFSGCCTNGQCTFDNGESFTINQNACALRGVNRPFLIDGADVPAGAAPTGVTTVTCNNGILSSSGDAVDENISSIGCSSNCVISYDFNPDLALTSTVGLATGTSDNAFGNCGGGLRQSNGTQCLVPNTGLISVVAITTDTDGTTLLGGISNLCNMANQKLAITDANGVTTLYPLDPATLVMDEQLTLTCEPNGDVTVNLRGAGGTQVVNDAIGLTCVQIVT